ncbi:Intersectin-2 [Dactylella cylindrospora]|nr:Intersectin-2 [Dactylella cylindrospora]
MKVPASCPGPLDKTAKKALKDERHNKVAKVSTDKLSELPASNGSTHGLNRTNTVTSVSTTSTALDRSGTVKSVASSSAAASSAKPPTRRVLAPPPAKYIAELPADGPAKPDGPKAKMLYGYTATGDEEISVGEGKEVVVVEPDEGGWTKIRNGMMEGLVPTTYIELLSDAPKPATPARERPESMYSVSTAASSIGKKKGPVVAPKRGAKKLQHVKAAYDYKARTEDEFDMAEGDKFVLIADDDGSGWAEVEKNGVKKMVPANYIEKI